MKAKTFKEREKEKIAKANQLWLNKKSTESRKKFKHPWNNNAETKQIANSKDEFQDLMHYK